MNLNIKSAEAHKMAVELAKQTGDSMTAAVTKAIQAALRRTRDKSARLKRINDILARIAPLAKDIPGSDEIDALLYDAHGLPK